MKGIKRILVASILALTMVLFSVVPAMAATTADVTITATPEFLSITNDSVTGQSAQSQKRQQFTLPPIA